MCCVRARFHRFSFRKPSLFIVVVTLKPSTPPHKPVIYKESFLCTHSPLAINAADAYLVFLKGNTLRIAKKIIDTSCGLYSFCMCSRNIYSRDFKPADFHIFFKKNIYKPTAKAKKKLIFQRGLSIQLKKNSTNILEVNHVGGKLRVFPRQHFTEWWWEVLPRIGVLCASAYCVYVRSIVVGIHKLRGTFLSEGICKCTYYAVADTQQKENCTDHKNAVVQNMYCVFNYFQDTASFYYSLVANRANISFGYTIYEMSICRLPQVESFAMRLRRFYADCCSIKV